MSLFTTNSTTSRYPANRRVLHDGKTPAPAFLKKKPKFLDVMAQYFNARAQDAHLTASDSPMEYSDLKWLQGIRGERTGVAKIVGINLQYAKKMREREKKDEQRREEEHLQRQKEKGERNSGNHNYHHFQHETEK